ncbi:dynamin family protein [Candidatus Symbiopectobacterium sp. NZEC135]|uniref:dynamin family protein n=1 Tax=Candidatus Symbiopectobacterium sp. NZEC135 TaxID=2820471 RepID=UPI0022278CE8|nr:dynamin family protein [Candidatus Symbiopectobacterium sp. NZEC135]MCW2480429.1 dynamin family protein [Candidatus Symbiopectobacterium sp. NZEC135]
MNSIYIEHNPFTVESVFLINGTEPAPGCKLSDYKEARLQLWVESLFNEIQALLNGETQFDVTFKGVESDYIDVQGAAEHARTNGMIIALRWEPVRATEDRLDEINALMAEAKKNDQFSKYIEDNEQVRNDFHEAFNNDFNVYVVATMSSGKSTLINAMLGQDLLPAANEATTATIAQIIDDKTTGSRFLARRFSVEGEQESHPDVSIETLKIWNSMEGTQEIELCGNIVAMQPRDHVRLVLTDTPGPNNSQDAGHELKTMSFIKDSRRNPLILYVLNGTQLGTNDDRNLLSLVAETMQKGGKQSKDRFIFVVNKMDAFDPESGEDVGAALGRVTEYLEANGIRNPQVYPVSAHLTRLLRKHPDSLTKKERGDLHTLTELFVEEPMMDFPSYMPLTSRVRRSLEERGLSGVLKRSGLPAVEVMIDEYIDKYNVPTRLNRAYTALHRAISLGMKETQLAEQLQREESELALINDEIILLQERRKKGLDTETYKDRVRREGKGLPKFVGSSFSTSDAKFRGILNELSNTISSQGEVDASRAQIELSNAERQLSFLHNDLIGDFETVFEASQQHIKDELNDEYKKFITSIFDETRQLSLPMLQGLKESIQGVSLNLDLNDRDIQIKQVVSGQREVSNSRWYNPFSWGSTRTVYEYRDVKYVDMNDVWKQKRTLVESAFNDLRSCALEKFETDKNKLVENYLAFIEREFNEKFDALVNALQTQLTDKGKREETINKAKEQQRWINDFKTKLDNTLAI